MARTLLIVDDVKSNREILKNILGDEYTVVEASQGQEALALMEREFDALSAVLLDLRMPVMDGFQVLERMRASQTLSQLPVIVMTGEADADTEEQALRLGAKDYISKPYKSAIIKQRIWNTINLRETAATVNALRRDRLTGLYSREAFFEQVSAMVAQHEPGYYIMACFDVDKFKIINDQYGTRKGDEVLRYIARVFSEGFEPQGGVCCRVSADDYAVLYPAAFQNTPELAAMRKKASRVDGLISPIAFSVGRYLVDDLSLSPSAMYDRAMMAADSIKGRYDVQVALYDESLRDRIVQTQQIVTEMEGALRERQFEVWYQPQYNHSTGALIGAEALARWRHPQRGLISPGVFIPVFEKTGFIYALDQYVWEEVCRLLQKGLAKGGSPLPISVNISRYDAFRPDLVEVITGLVARYGIPVELLRLEITESAFAEDTRKIVSVAKQLIEYGFTLEIDDFGSAYSSLNTLKSVPAQVVKLDMRFFDDDSQRSGNIIESVVRMTKWLDMSVIAEGVERIEQADFLRSIGCNYIQGYLYARPMPLAEYEALCENAGKGEKRIALETVENLDNNSFWDPKSMDTLIFNSFVGGACIYEYCQGKIELLRATEKYAQVIGSAGMTVEDALRLNWTEHLDADSLKRVVADLDESVATRKEVTGEYVFLDLPGCPRETYLRATLRVIASVGNRYLVYCTNENITAQRQSEKRERKATEQMRLIMANVNSGICASTYGADGNVQILFANDSYYAMFGYTKAQFDTELASPLDPIVPEDRERTMRIVERLVRERSSGMYSYRCFKRDGSMVTVRCSNTITSFEGVSDTVLLAVITDTTELALTQQKERQATEQLQAIMSDIDSGITAAVLDEQGRITLLFTNEKFFEIHGYTRAQYEAEVSDDKFALVYPDDREMVRRETVQAYRTRTPVRIEYRLLHRDGAVGWVRVGLSSTRFTGVEQNVHLCIFTDITAEKHAEQELMDASAQMLAMMNDIPGGFARLRVDPDGSIKPVYLNEGLLRLVGMSHDEAMALYSNDARDGVHPDDVGIVNDVIARMFANGEAHSSRYRLRHGDDGYIWLSIFGRVTKDGAGVTYLNIYYSDASEEVKEEEAQRTLLDNLPCGAGIYELKDGQMNLTYQNQSYWDLVGLHKADFPDTAPMSAVHPDDIPVIMRELQSAIEQGRDVVCDIRLRHLAEGYCPVRLVGRIVPKGPGSYLIFATFTPNKREGVTYQQTLPLLLSAIMESTTDLSFAKDKELRYLSASRAFARLVGWESERDIVGKTDFDLFEPSLAEKYRQDDEALLASGKAIVDRVESLPPVNGTPRYSSTSKYLLRDGDGEVIGLYGVGRDVTQTVALDSQLRLLNDSIPGGLATYLCTPGDFIAEHIHITYFNDGFCKLFGFTREEYERHAAADPTSMLYAEDRPIIAEQWQALMREGTPINCLYRAHVKGGGYRWISHKAVAVDWQATQVILNAVLQDVTDQRELIEQLRISEEENSLAAHLSGQIICRYLVAERSLTMAPEAAAAFGLADTIYNVPYEPVRLGMISPESTDAYTGFFEAILRGSKAGTVTFRQMYMGEWRWIEAKSSTIFSDDGRPVKAVISMLDVTERLEKETIYRKWQQSLEDMAPESYTLFRCNLNDDSAAVSADGTLIDFDFERAGRSFNERAREYMRRCVWAEDQDRYTAFVNSDALLAGYYRGKRSEALEYREAKPEGAYRWLRLTVDLVEYPNSTEVEAYLMYEDIDKAKRAELQTRELVENDPLTGVLNRNAFADKVGQIIRASKPETRNALLMLDIDGFKQVNDVFGHRTGDQTLVEMAGSFRSMLRRDDLLGRIGGDEFVMLLTDIADDTAVANKAMQLCAVARKSFSLEVQITGSIGVAVAPRDGLDFETLYKKADAAMYYVKGSGKDSCAFYRDDMEHEHLEPEADTELLPQKEKKRRMLIVDDSALAHLVLGNIFAEEFIIEKAKDGNAALIRLRHYGSAISVVLLDLIMPGMDGFAVLKKMRESAEMRGIPVVVVSANDDPMAGLEAIRAGAVDFVTKPVDPEILRIRVQSAISKAENERLRAKNSVLEYQESEVSKYKAVLERSGVLVVEHDWVGGVFTYDPAMADRIAGVYDERGLWHILLADFVADTVTVKTMQETVHRIAVDRDQTEAQLLVRLKTPSKQPHWFRMGVYKVADEYGLTGKIYLTFIDLGANLPQRA